MTDPQPPAFTPLSRTTRGGDGYARFLAELRRLGDVATVLDAPEHVYDELASRLSVIVDDVQTYRAPEGQGPAGRRPDLPGRGLLLLPDLRLVAEEGGVRGEVCFGERFTGWTAAHGGAVSLVFDEVLGAVATATASRPVRTAWLRVDYRAPTPVGRPLAISARIDAIAGRKLRISGELRDGDTVCAEAESLMVVLRDADDPGERAAG